MVAIFYRPGLPSAFLWFTHLTPSLLGKEPSFLSCTKVSCFLGPLPPQDLEFTYRFHQAAGAAMELSAWSSSRAGHGKGHRPGSPGHAAAPTTGSGLIRPGAAVDGREAAVEFLAGLSPLQP